MRARERDLANFLTSKSKGCDVDKFQAPVFPLEIMEGTKKWISAILTNSVIYDENDLGST